MHRGLIHFHSRFSYDSITSIKSIANFAVRNKLNFLILTDHDTIDGACKLKEYVDEKNLNLEILIAAEYKTSLGDIIALGIKKEILNMEFDSFVSEVRMQGGIILFPHPYVGHKQVEKIAIASDMIEIFNSRVSDHLNKKAAELAKTFDKPIYFSADAHSLNELNNSIIEFSDNGGFIKSLLTSKINRLTAEKSKNYEIIYSQIIKSIKKRDLRLLMGNILKLILSIQNINKSL